MKIFIEYSEEDEVIKFAAKLINKLKSTIKYEFSIDTWFTVDESLNLGIPDDNGEYGYLNTFDIIISIITSETTLTDDILNEQLKEFSEKRGKYLIPIIYSPTHWSSTNWVVKNKIFPETDDSLSELTYNLQVITLNSIVELVDSILSKTIKLKSETNKVSEIKKSIFISHSHDDADFAELIHNRLDKAGISCWIDSEELKIGQDWRKEIDEGISNSVAVIAIITPESKKSEYVTYEWAFAWGMKKKIFPILLKQTNLHPRLESLQYLDFTNRNSRPWENLIQSVKQIMIDNYNLE